MLSISQAIRGGGGYYAGGGAEDYYAGKGEGQGIWWGEVATDLGLRGPVTADEFSNVLSGFSPDGEHALVQNAGMDTRQEGWDFTFSAPKSVSVLWSQLPEGWQQEIGRIQDAAARRALAYLEKVAGFTRRGAFGESLESSRLLFALFPHLVSRENDPQLHTHCVLVNLSLRADGTTGTLWSRELFRHKMAAGALYRAELASQLERRLGIRIERDGLSFRVLGVSREAVQAFSSRRKQVLEAMEGRREGGAIAAKRAALATRSAKEKVDPAQLRATWRCTGEAHGFGRAEAESLLANSGQVRLSRHLELEGLLQVTKEQSHFPIRDLVRRVSECAVGTGTDADSVLKTVEATERTLVAVGEVRGETRFTTHEILKSEQALLDTASRMASENRHPVSAELEVPDGSWQGLSDEQRNAVRHLTQESGDLALLLGLAGTGKTSLLGAARQVWEAAGYELMGAAISGKAAAGLEDGTGIPAQTLASLLLAIRESRKARLPGPIAARSICVLDEAGMVGTRQLGELMHECLRVGAKLVLVGDHQQLQPIEAGGPFRQLIETTHHASLTTIVRQKEAWARDAVRSLADGDGSSALSAFQRNGQVSVASSAIVAGQALVSDWAKAGSRDPANHLIITNEVAHAAFLNHLAQERRMQDGRLSGTPVELPNGVVFEGDRVVFLRNSRSLEVQNGLMGTVSLIHGEHLVVRLDSGKTTAFDARAYPHISLGYAVTTHKSQGATAEHVYALVGGSMQCRELSYVQVSRSRESTRLFVDEDNAGPDLEKLESAMNESRPKLLATAIARSEEEQHVLSILR